MDQKTASEMSTREPVEVIEATSATWAKIAQKPVPGARVVFTGSRSHERIEIPEGWNGIEGRPTEFIAEHVGQWVSARANEMGLKLGHAKHLRIRGLRILQTLGTAIWSKSLDDVRFEQCWISGAATHGLFAHDGAYRTRVHRCLIERCGTNPWHHHAVYGFPWNSSWFTANIVRHNAGVLGFRCDGPMTVSDNVVFCNGRGPWFRFPGNHGLPVSFIGVEHNTVAWCGSGGRMAPGDQRQFEFAADSTCSVSPIVLRKNLICGDVPIHNGTPEKVGITDDDNRINPDLRDFINIDAGDWRVKPGTLSEGYGQRPEYYPAHTDDWDAGVSPYTMKTTPLSIIGA